MEIDIEKLFEWDDKISSGNIELHEKLKMAKKTVEYLHPSIQKINRFEHKGFGYFHKFLGKSYYHLSKFELFMRQPDGVDVTKKAIHHLQCWLYYEKKREFESFQIKEKVNKIDVAMCSFYLAESLFNYLSITEKTYLSSIAYQSYMKVIDLQEGKISEMAIERRMVLLRYMSEQSLDIDYNLNWFDREGTPFENYWP